MAQSNPICVSCGQFDVYSSMYTTWYNYIVSVFDKYLSDTNLSHQKATKKVLRYLHGTNDFVLTNRQPNIFYVVGYCDADYVGCAYCVYMMT